MGDEIIHYIESRLYLLSVIGSFLLVLPMIFEELTCPPSLLLTVFYPIVWVLLPSLILVSLVTALYRGIKDLKTEVNQMDHENIRNNESLKEYKFRAKLLMGIVTVFILSAVVSAIQLVSLIRWTPFISSTICQNYQLYLVKIHQWLSQVISTVTGLYVKL